jgi:hypothetical protein
MNKSRTRAAWSLRVSASLLLAAITAGGAQARPLSVLSFNAEHMMSAERFDRWVSFCGPLDWNESRATARPESLTYCNALDGTDGRGRRLSAPVRDRKPGSRRSRA